MAAGGGGGGGGGSSGGGSSGFGEFGTVGGGGRPSGSAGGGSGGGGGYESQAGQLAAMGFDKSKALEILSIVNGNMELAIEMLSSG